MVFIATFNNTTVILWRSVLLVNETGVPRENHRPVANHWQTWSHIDYASPWPRFELRTLVVIGTDCTGSYKSNYHTITATTEILLKVALNTINQLSLNQSTNTRYFLLYQLLSTSRRFVPLCVWIFPGDCQRKTKKT
jgi:hypothetical protein